MTRDKRYLISAAVVGAYAFIMYAASGLFFSSYLELTKACSMYGRGDCFANESVIVSAISFRIGMVAFFLVGTFAWGVASYLGIKWWSLNHVGRLP